jgi:acyl carrier protein
VSELIPDQDDLQRWVIEVMREFRLPVSSADDDFFGSGGTSISLMRLIARAESSFGVTLELEDVLDASSVGGIAERIRDAADAAPLPEPVEEAT